MIDTYQSSASLKRCLLLLSVYSVVVVLTFFLVIPDGVSAAQIDVNSAEDTAIAGDLKCTLREAINNANADTRDTTGGDCARGDGQGGPQDIIIFNESVSGTITLGLTLPTIVSAHGLIIDGGVDCVVSGVIGQERVCRGRRTISGNHTVRVFVVDSLTQLTLQNLAVTRGNNEGDGSGIFNRGELTIINSTFSNQSASHIVDPFFKVIEVSGGNVLLNADDAQGGVGATLTPLFSADRVLQIREQFGVNFVIGLQTRERFTFEVDLLGVPNP